MTPTAYIVTPIGTPPEHDGLYTLSSSSERIFENVVFFNGKWMKFIDESILDIWLRPVNLSDHIVSIINQKK